MIKCDKCGAINSDERLICCDCGRELVKANKSSFNVVPEFVSSSKTGSSSVGYDIDTDINGRCKNCGQKFLDGDLFCTKCGARRNSAYYSSEEKNKGKKNGFIVLIFCLLAALLLLVLLNIFSGLSLFESISSSRRYKIRGKKKETYAFIQLKDIKTSKNIPF